MAKQTINVGSTSNDKSGDTLRSGAIKINNNFSEVYNGLNGVIDKFQPGSHITLTKTAGVCTINAEIVPYTLVAANTGNLGGVRIPAVDVSGITNTAGIIGLATASNTQLGGVKVDNSTITINGSGVINANYVAQVQSDWNAVSGLGVVLNKPTIPAAQVHSDWNAVSGLGVVLNKPTIPAAQVQSDWNAVSGLGVVLNKPTIPAAQVQSDWDAVSGLGVVLNKPTIPNAYTLTATTASALGGVIVPAVATSGITNNSGTIGLATASSSQLGGIKIGSGFLMMDGTLSALPSAGLSAANTTTLGGVIIPAVATSGITNSSGTIGLAIASNTQLGGVKVDGNTITIDQVTGVISSTGGGSGLTSRTVASATSASLTAANSGTYTITGFKGYAILSVQTSAAAWVTIYSSVSAQSADASRIKTTDPVPGSGVIAEVITTSSVTQYFSPAVVGYSSESTPTTNIPIKIYNNGSSAAIITVTLTLIKLEA